MLLVGFIFFGGGEIQRLKKMKEKVIDRSIPVNNLLSTENVPVNHPLLTGSVPVNNSLLTGSVPVNNYLLTGTVLDSKPSINDQKLILI